MKGYDEYFREVLRIPIQDLNLITQERCTDKALNEQNNYDNNFNVINLGACYQSLEELNQAVQANFNLPPVPEAVQPVVHKYNFELNQQT